MVISTFTNISLKCITVRSLSDNSPFLSFSPTFKKSNFLIQNSKFSNLFGNALFSNSPPSFTRIRKTDFSNSLTTAISLDSQNFDKITFKSRPEINSSYLQITECQFLRCKSQHYSFNSLEGGGLLLRGIISDISKCVFRQCFAYQNGAAIRVSSSARIDIRDTLIAENVVMHWCGGVSVYFAFNFTMEDCNITNNKSTEKVGALMSARVLDGSLSNLILSNNTAYSHAASWIESSKMLLSNVIFVMNNADIASSIVATQRADATINQCFFSDLNKNPSILCENHSKLSITESLFSGVLSDEIIKEENGEVTTNDCKEGEKTEVVLPELTELPPDVETEDVKIDVIPNLNINQPMNDIQRPGVNRHTFDPEADTHGVDKSTIMIIAYAIVIMLLIIGLRMYFTTGETQQNANNSTSIFGDDDYENNAADFLHTSSTPVSGENQPLGSKPEMEKLKVQDVPLEERP